MNDLAIMVKNLYIKQELSGVEVARILKLNKRYVYRVMEKNNIKRRKASESNTIKFLKESPTFKIKTNLKSNERTLLACGVMLYWAEGWKDKRKQLFDFANSDPVMIKIFLRFLREICGIKEEKLRIYLYCYANQDVNKIKKFWSKVTLVPIEQFTKPYIRQDFREDKIGKMPNGLIHVRYCDKKLYSHVLHWHDKLVKQWAVG